MSSPTPPPPEDASPHGVITCSACHKPLFPFSDIIPEKIDFWSKAVYSYQLEEILPSGGVEGGCHLYSATNPTQNRFDVFRVRVAPENDGQNNDLGSSTRRWYTKTVIAQTSRYTALHTWFPGYCWSMLSCKNCRKHLGWGFSPKMEGDNTGETDDEKDDEEEEEEQEHDHENDEEEWMDIDEDDDDGENEREEEEANFEEYNAEDAERDRAAAEANNNNNNNNNNNENPEDENPKEKSKKEKQKKERPPRIDRDPTFLGVIFSHIRAREMTEEKWSKYLKSLSSIAHMSNFDLIRNGWPAVDENYRPYVYQLVKQLLTTPIQGTEYRFAVGLALRSSQRGLFSILLNANAIIDSRKHRREEEEAGSLDDEDYTSIRGMKKTIKQSEEDYELLPNEDEEKYQADEDFFNREKKRVDRTPLGLMLYCLEDDDVDDDVKKQNRECQIFLLMCNAFVKRWENEYDPLIAFDRRAEQEAEARRRTLQENREQIDELMANDGDDAVAVDQVEAEERERVEPERPLTFREELVELLFSAFPELEVILYK